MIATPIHWYTWELFYSHDVIGTNKILGIGEKVPPVLLQIEVVLLNK